MTPPDRIAEIRAAMEKRYACDCSSLERSHDGNCASRTLYKPSRADVGDLLAALYERDREIERLREETRALGLARDEALDNADVSHRKAHRFSLERDAAFRAGAEVVRALPVPEPKR